MNLSNSNNLLKDFLAISLAYNMSLIPCNSHKAEAIARRCSVKKVFLEILERRTPVPESLF